MKKKEETPLSSDGQPINKAFNAKFNMNKAAASLKGILTGITADYKLKEIEILFLQSWLSQQTYRKEDVLDMYYAVNNILEDGIITSEELKDLTQLIDDCIEYGPNLKDEKSKINEFIGFVNGIICDNEINQDEFEKLVKKLNELNRLSNHYPINIIKDIVKKILLDSHVEKSELDHLLEVLISISGTDFTNDGDAIGGATTLFNESVSSVLNKVVCVTGKFLFGNRKKVSLELEKMGATVENNVTKRTNILLIGTFSSRDWVYSSSGRKIERAIELRGNGSDIIITNEKTFFENN